MLFGAPRMPINPSEATDPTAAPDMSTAYSGKLNFLIHLTFPAVKRYPHLIPLDSYPICEPYQRMVSPDTI